jgi:transcriptional regulator with XRE-family HTH domain
MNTNNSENIIGERIKQAREEMRLTHKELGQKIGYKDGVYISRWESGDRHPGSRNLQRIAGVLNKPMSYFFPGENLTPTHVDIRLPELLSVFKRTLGESEERYRVISSTMRIVEVPIMTLDTLRRGFVVGTHKRYVQIPRDELQLLNDKDIGDRFILEVTTDAGEDFGIRKGASVLINYKPPKIDGALYLITYQQIMTFRHIKWEGGQVILIDSKGIRITAPENTLTISGQVLKIYYTHNPPQIQV